MRVVMRRHTGVERLPAQNVMPCEGEQHRMLDVVIERVAVANAFKRNASDGRHHLDQTRLRRAKTALHMGSEKRTKGIRRELWNRYRHLLAFYQHTQSPYG